jgi:predicted RecB family nuclease
LDTFTIALPSGPVAVPYAEYAQALDAAVDTWRRIRSGTHRPEPPGIDKTGSPWTAYANKQLIERLDLTLLSDVGPAGRETIRKRLGANSIRDLYGRPVEDLIAAMGDAGRWIHACVRGYEIDGPVVTSGAPVRIPRGRRTFSLDFETSDDAGPEIAQPPHAYLAGLWDFQSDRFVRFAARGPGEEAKMFAEMLAYVGDPSDACVHTWTTYENGVLAAAGERHPALKHDLDRFATACVDLKEAVKTQVALPVPTYSLKFVAPQLGFQWRHSNFGAFESMCSYWSSLCGAPDSFMSRPHDYHEDDVRAMAHVVRTLDGLPPTTARA